MSRRDKERTCQFQRNWEVEAIAGAGVHLGSEGRKYGERAAPVVAGAATQQEVLVAIVGFVCV